MARRFLRRALNKLARGGVQFRLLTWRGRAKLSRLEAEFSALRERILLHAALRAATRAPCTVPCTPGETARVAVILPTRNRAVTVGEAIASVQAQSFGNWTLAIIDDGSTDDTEQTIAPFLVDPRIRFIRQPPANAAAARNHGIAVTTAPLIAYIDSDNIWLPGHLAHAVAALDANPTVDLIYTALITDQPGPDGARILAARFDRAALLDQNFIDANVMVHRRSLVERHGGWDERLDRLADWDLVLRYTEHKPALRVLAHGACYRRMDTARITDRIPIGPAWTAIIGKWFPPPSLPARRPRVLYITWQYPHLSETYVETEIRQMRAWGVHIELWRMGQGPAPYPFEMTIHEGSIAEAIAASRPDIIHVHWIGIGLINLAALRASGLPVTLRLHGFDTTRNALNRWLSGTTGKASAGIYGYSAQLARLGLHHPRLKQMPANFDTSLFATQPNKDLRLIVRASAGLPSKNLELFFAAAARLPEYRFVLAVVPCHDMEYYIEELEALNRGLGSPVEIRHAVPRDEVAKLIASAGIYLHTTYLPGEHPDATPIGEPCSIAEALATGCYCLVRDHPGFAAMIGSAGSFYHDLASLTDAIDATRNFSDEKWQAIRQNASDRAFVKHADIRASQAMFNEWCGYL